MPYVRERQIVVCTHCEKPIVGSVALCGGDPFHSDCLQTVMADWERVEVCHYCHQGGATVYHGEQPFHPDCLEAWKRETDRLVAYQQCITNLGTMNAWGDTLPPALVQCKMLGHTPICVNPYTYRGGRIYNTTWQKWCCPDCGIRWEVDSSD